AALELLWRAESRPDPLSGASALEGLRAWATYCALAERHGGRWSKWPETLRDVAGPAVASARHDLAPRVAFHAWVQQQCAEQLSAV
ncbi:4-alpha-glucanotransferase, partial [Mycobacterium sp. ITM-2017-0098]